MAFRLVLVLAFLIPSLGQAAVVSERLEYRWQFEGMGAWLGRLFFPTKGEGALTRESLENGNLRGELVITARNSHGADYFRYASEFDPETLVAVRAWSSSRWQGKERSKSVEVKEAGVIDLVSGIEWIRRKRPKGPIELKFWSDGKLYWVRVRPLTENRHTSQMLESYVVEPVERPGQRIWSGRLELKLAADTTPVEILLQRSTGKVRLVIERGGTDARVDPS
jgi:hypothetical protein